MYTSPSPLPRRGPLRLPFSVHIRKLFFLFLSLFSGAPRWTHPVGAGVPDGPHRFSSTLPAGLFRAPARHPFAHGGPLIFLFLPPAAIFLSTAKEIWKRTPPKTHGLWNSFAPNVIRRKKAHKESLPLLPPLPLPRTARVACYDRLRYSATRAAAAPAFHTRTFFSRAV